MEKLPAVSIQGKIVGLIEGSRSHQISTYLNVWTLNGTIGYTTLYVIKDRNIIILINYQNSQEHIYRCNHYVLEVGNKSHVCSRGGHKGSPYGPPWAQFRKIFHCILEDICRCIRLFHPCTYHHSAQRIQIGYRQDTYFITCDVRLRKFKQYIGCFQ